MKRVLVVTENAYLGQKIRLALLECAEVSVSEKYLSGYGLCLWDVDTVGTPMEDVVTMSRDGECDIRVPFSYDKLFGLLSEEKSGAAIRLSGRVCELYGEKIKLTELESKLLSLLISANGGFVSREVILDKLWGEGVDAGVINVYVHYLREKLERGEKIIISSRNHGYKIDAKYLSEVENA